MDKYEHRRLRLLEARDRFLGGSTSALADKIGRSPSYVSRMLYPAGKEGKKRIAEDMVDIVEDAFGWGKGWMDSTSPLPDAMPANAPAPVPLAAQSADSGSPAQLSQGARELIATIVEADRLGLPAGAFTVLRQTLQLFARTNSLPEGTLGIEDPPR